MMPSNHRWMPRADGRVAAAVPALAPHAAVVAGEIACIAGVTPAAVVGSGRAGDVVLGIDPDLPQGGHRVEVDDRVVVVGADRDAVATGTAALLAGLEAEGGLRRGNLEEVPCHHYRGLMIDCARHHQSVALLRDVVVLCRLHRINHLQLHLNDDEAFTFPSRRHPDLVTPGRGHDRDELIALAAFAEARGVQIVPELDVPGHCAALTAARPELFGHAGRVSPSVVHMGRPEVVTVLGELIDEMCAVFPAGQWFHLGGDEVDLGGIGSDPDAARYMREHGLQDPAALAGDFAVRMCREVRRRGRRPVLWEGLRREHAAALPRDVVFAVWDTGWYPPDAAIEDGFCVINASFCPLYVVGGGGDPDARRAFGADEVLAWHPRRWQHVEPGRPASAGLEVGAQGDGVLGAQMCVWEQRADSVIEDLLVRLPAFGERAWHGDGSLDPAAVRSRAAASRRLFDRLLGGGG